MNVYPDVTADIVRVRRLSDFFMAASTGILSPNVNFFLQAPVTPDGKLDFAEGSPESGRFVELRADMDVIALVSACPQLNNSCNAYNPTPIRLMIWDV